MLQDFSKMASGYCSSNSDTELGLHYTYTLYIIYMYRLKKTIGMVIRSPSDSTSGKSKQCK